MQDGAPNKGSWSRRAVLGTGVAMAGAALLPVRGAIAATPGDSITAMDALSLSRAIHARQISCVEVMNAYLERIERVNPKVNAIVALQPREGLLGQARARDAELTQGHSAGWMHGFPLAPKDLVAVKGLPYTDGSPLFKDRIAEADSLMVERMRKAGGIFIGKTNTPEFGLGSHTYNAVYGTTFNAYDQTKSAGGSSGGAAVGVSTRMLPVADGSDMGGSLRNPAGWNNIVSLRPTYGRVPDGGGFLMDMSVNGPMARSVPDLAMLLSTIAGPVPGQPLTINEDPRIFAGSLAMDVKGVRIGWLGNFGTLPMEAGVLPLCRTALKVFEDMGAIVADATVPASLDEMWQNFTTLRAWGNASWLGRYYQDPAKRPLLKPEAQFEVEKGLGLSASDVSLAMRGRAQWYRAFSSLFNQFDFLVAPTAQLFAFDAKEHWPTEISGTKMDAYYRWMEIVTPITMTSCPVLTVPAGFSPAGQAMGIQIVAPLRREIDCLRLANAYGHATRWPERRPPSI